MKLYSIDPWRLLHKAHARQANETNYCKLPVQINCTLIIVNYKYKLIVQEIFQRVYKLRRVVTLQRITQAYPSFDLQGT